jgi:hypothetical protein
VHFGGYSIGHRGGHPHVRLSLATYRSLKVELMCRASHTQPGPVKAMLYLASPLPYAPVRRQQLNLLRAVNRERLAHGLQPLAASVLDFRHRRSGPLVMGSDNTDQDDKHRSSGACGADSPLDATLISGAA